ncbi:MAG: hypothetical protein HY313_01560 [Acidobacteria bacterium]|nr:hypothetical protein [Acidobacteriota bacterium]
MEGGRKKNPGVIAGAALLAILLIWQCLPGVAQGNLEWDEGLSEEAAQMAALKFSRINESSQSNRSFGSIELSEQEANSYFRYKMASSLPPGVSKIRLKFQSDRPTGFVLVDFDKIKETASTTLNPALSYFLQGIHTVGVGGTFSSSNGVGQFHLETVTLDGYTLPQFVVDFLIERYVKSRYPNVALDRPFSLPFSIEQANVEEGAVVLVGRSDEQRNTAKTNPALFYSRFF